MCEPINPAAPVTRADRIPKVVSSELVSGESLMKKQSQVDQINNLVNVVDVLGTHAW